MYGELYGTTGPFRAGPPIEKFEKLMGEFASEVDADWLSELSVGIDRFVYGEALSLLLAFPQALYAYRSKSTSSATPPHSSSPRPRSPKSTGRTVTARRIEARE